MRPSDSTQPLSKPGINKGEILNRLCKYAEAVNAYDRATELDPEDAATWNKKGIILKLLGRIQKPTSLLPRRPGTGR